ncbi:MAG: DUF481 domain-containing protein [Candidatus Dactylopiibacterium sp.]|nr:DUF481 domain-containing protein [Candidatus Dactylopiibacterium sp.]
MKHSVTYSVLVVALLATASPAQADDLPSAVNDPMFGKLASDPPLKDDGSGKWQGSLGAGLTLRRGSSNSTEGSLSLDAAREMRESRLTANALAVRSSRDGERSGDTANGEFRGERRLSRNMFGFAGLGAERDALQDMTFRSSLSSGVGTRWVDNDTTQFNLYGGLAYSMERYTDGRSPKGVEVLLGTELRHQISETSRITHRLVAYPDSISGGARFAMQGDLTTRINAHFGLQLSVLQKYREKVAEQNSHIDTVFFTGITAGF